MVASSVLPRTHKLEKAAASNAIDDEKALAPHPNDLKDEERTTKACSSPAGRSVLVTNR